MRNYRKRQLLVPPSIRGAQGTRWTLRTQRARVPQRRPDTRTSRSARLKLIAAGEGRTARTGETYALCCCPERRPTNPSIPQRSEQYPSLATVTKALHDPDGVSEAYLACRPTSHYALRQFILSESKPRKPRGRDVDLFSVISAASSKFKPWKTPGKDTDKSSVISVASNKYAMLANLRRGSRDH